MGRGKPFKQPLTKLIEAGVVPRPVWLDIVEATRPPFEPVRSTKSREIRYPEDRLRATYLQRNPEARRIPVNLLAESITDRHVSDRFVAFQMRLMNERKLSEEEAYKLAEEAMQKKKTDADALVVDSLSGPLEDCSIDDATSRLYFASVKDSQRDQKLYQALNSDPTSNLETK